jgi:hypothetical protein
MCARRPFAALIALPLLLASCREAKVASYRVPKEKETPPAAAAAESVPAMASAPVATAPAPATMANTAVPVAEGAGLTWTAPAHWQLMPAAPMRKATYSVAGEGGAKAELSITAFPNAVGGEFANVNRWRGQVQLPAFSEAEAATGILRFESNGLKFAVVDFVNPAATPQHLLGAILPVNGPTWFFKFTGPDALVAREKTAFMEFLKTVKPPATP